ncbi:MAG: bifunctional diaminohydroxyphosphoribosylaminopyrimidine deaminase/5-amino-6-(5-phosphoribosylamino)uracil reductase RibD [candidate division Zixibacteria bacterium]|nr:bifunctional diaminohydroxyphosphoribosylaminopyrimidine deaminase/5-amino-6-(5-phosphoribosylamino)uracil reductase RibD [candidate division Zixibacteria bacterium]
MAVVQLYKEMMKRAFVLARRAEGKTAPNPMVGAVIFKGENIIATGYHKKSGTLHAEINALKKAGSDAKGASIAINLEPCCHKGKTGPCTEALIAAGIKKVIYGAEDPYKEVNGRSRVILEEKGIEVITGVCAKEAKRLNEVYYHFHSVHRPFVIVKSAQTLDGRIASVTGDSKWITGPSARAFAHKLRARYDAVMVGSGTVKTDNPELTVRSVKGKNPLRIILTSSDALPMKLGVFEANEDNKTVIATSRAVMSKKVYNQFITWPVKTSPRGLDLNDFLKRAAKHGVMSILVEGGSKLTTSLFRERLVDKYYQFIAPMMLGEGISGIGDLGLNKIAQAISFHDCGFRKLGNDRLFWGYPRR